MQRIILHSDLNNFYASVECLYRPELKNVPVAVGGDVEKRHGIVLAKNPLAKSFGVKTGMALWQARQLCPGLVTLPPNFPLYVSFSEKVRKIYLDYTNRIEPFGIDEAWLDVTGNVPSYDAARAFADRLRGRIWEELGITVSIGVSFNKVFAKLGSDMKKPDATTLILPESYREKVWPLPASELLFVGRSTASRLKRCGIHTIGDLAAADAAFLQRTLGKNGLMLWRFASGFDCSPVAEWGSSQPVKSVGNSTTTPRDMENDDDVRLVLLTLSESVASRLREQELLCGTVSLWVRDNELVSFERQTTLKRETCLSSEIAAAAFSLFREHYHWERPLRSVGVRGSGLVPNGKAAQLSVFDDEQRRARSEQLERAVDQLRGRFGYYSVRRGLCLTDTLLSGFLPKEIPNTMPTAQ